MYNLYIMDTDSHTPAHARAQTRTVCVAYAIAHMHLIYNLYTAYIPPIHRLYAADMQPIYNLYIRRPWRRRTRTAELTTRMYGVASEASITRIDATSAGLSHAAAANNIGCAAAVLARVSVFFLRSMRTPRCDDGFGATFHRLFDDGRPVKEPLR